MFGVVTCSPHKPCFPTPQFLNQRQSRRDPCPYIKSRCHLSSDVSDQGAPSPPDGTRLWAISRSTQVWRRILWARSRLGSPLETNRPILSIKQTSSQDARTIGASASSTEDAFSCLLRAAFPPCSSVTHDVVGGRKGSKSDGVTGVSDPRLSSMVMTEYSHDVSHGQVPAHFPRLHQWPRAAPRRLDVAARPPISHDT